MKEETPYVHDLEEENSFFVFRSIFMDLLFYDKIIIFDDYNRNPDRQIRSAKEVHNKVVGVLSGDPDYIYLFPELLTKSLKKIHKSFCRKKHLQKMLIENDLIIKDDEGNVEKVIWYHHNLIKVWEFDWYKFTSFSNRDY